MRKRSNKLLHSVRCESNETRLIGHDQNKTTYPAKSRWHNCLLAFNLSILKSLWGSLWSSVNLILMPHILPASGNGTIGEEIKITILPLLGPLSQRKLYQPLYGTPEETMSCLRTWSIHCSILCLWPNWYFANKWRVSSTLFQKNAHARQDLCDSKQHHVCPHVALQSTQNERSSKGLKAAIKNLDGMSATSSCVQKYLQLCLHTTEQLRSSNCETPQFIHSAMKTSFKFWNSAW